MRAIFKFSFSLLFLFQYSAMMGQTPVAKTQILILGTQHLNQVQDFEASMLDELIRKLDGFAFDAVCVENMPGELLYDIRSRNDSSFDALLESFGGSRLDLADSAQAILGINFVTASNKVRELLEKDAFSDNDHKLLMEYFLATSDLPSVVLHYYHLNDKSILKQSLVGDLLLDCVKQNLGAKNEIYSLALPVAFNQKLNKIEPIDNFQDEALLLKCFPGFIQDYMANQEFFKDVGNAPVFAKVNELQIIAIEKKDLLDLYLFFNSTEYQAQDFEAQWAIWLNSHFPSGSDRSRYALWEMRNLQIAANIVRTAAFYPGKKILVIIGASHKSFLEKYLKQISDLEIIEFK